MAAMHPVVRSAAARCALGVALAGLVAAVPFAAFAQGGAAKPSAAVVQAELDALVRAAKSEGEVTLYTAAPEGIPRRIAAAFQSKYGIKVSFVRLSTAPLAQRYFAEAESGNVVADIVWTAGSGAPYTTDGIKRGFVEPLSAANLPVVRSGEFPARFFEGDTAIVQISPWGIAYNTEKVKGAEIPKDWPDLLDPKWKGKIVLADPRVGFVFTQFWLLIRDKYGDSFFTKLNAQEPRRYPSGIPAIQALAAGEGSLYPPVIAAVYSDVKLKGAPVDAITPAFTTGTQFYIILSARAKVKHPNAGRLLANYVMSPEGNKVFNDEPGVAGVYDTGRLPKQFALPKPVTQQQVNEVGKLLGFQ